MSLQQTIQQLLEYQQFLIRIRSYCESDEQRKSFDDALAVNKQCREWLKQQGPSPALVAWSKGEKEASKNYNPPPWSPKATGKGEA